MCDQYARCCHWAEIPKQKRRRGRPGSLPFHSDVVISNNEMLLVQKKLGRARETVLTLGAGFPLTPLPVLHCTHHSSFCACWQQSAIVTPRSRDSVSSSSLSRLWLNDVTLRFPLDANRAVQEVRYFSENRADVSLAVFYAGFLIVRKPRGFCARGHISAPSGFPDYPPA